MGPEEKIARQLIEKLSEVGISAEVQGTGSHQTVEIAAIGYRSLSVSCYWYEYESSAMMIGLNPANSRSQLRKSRQPTVGAEFYIQLESEDKRIADGRTQEQEEVVACARSWLSGATYDAVVEIASFIDVKRRKMKTIAAQFDPQLDWEILDDLGCELWVYGNLRSCQIMIDSIAYYVGQAQVAFQPHLESASENVAVWILENVSLSTLAERGVQLERHAELIECDSAGWHWLHVRDRIANPKDVLYPLASLITALAESPIASQFYTFSSLNRFCFSASSHYPWVGLFPGVSLIGEGKYSVGKMHCNLPEAVAEIEAVLSRSPVKPFFGSEPDHDLPIFAKIFSQQGDRLRPQIVRRGQWSDVVVSHSSRRCQLSSDSIVCREGNKRLGGGSCATAEDVVHIANRFLLEQISFDQLKEDPLFSSFR